MCEPIVPPTEKAKMFRIMLMILGIIHLVLAIMYCFCNTQSGIYELVIVSILFCSIASVNFCCLMMYMIYISMNFFTFLSTIGLVIQVQSFVKVFQSGSSPAIFQFVVILMLFVYYIVAIILCYCAYREFKGMLFDATGHVEAGMMGMPGLGGASSSAA